MSWDSTAPTIIVAARDRVLESATVQTILTGLTTPQQQARFHYPDADPTTDTMPFFVVDRLNEKHHRATVGGSMGEGEIEVVLYLDASTPIGTTEGYVSIADDLMALTTAGLYLISAETERASRPTAGMQATNDAGQVEVGKSYITIATRMQWEG